MAKIVIDTNEFIDILKLNEDEIKKYLKSITDHISHFIFPKQIIDETIRNTLKEQNNYAKNMESKYQLYDVKTCQLLKNGILTKQLKNINKKLIEAKENDIKNYNKKTKLVLDMLNNLDSSKILPTTTNILEKASHRKLCGNPPSSNTRIGDEIIWETLMEWAEDDLVLVTNDHTFFEHEEFLNIEYKKKNKSLLKVFKNLTDAIEFLGLNSQELLKIEKREQELSQKEVEKIKNGYITLFHELGKMAIIHNRLSELNYYKFANYLNHNALQEVVEKINNLKFDIKIDDSFSQITRAQEILSQIKPTIDPNKQ